MATISSAAKIRCPGCGSANYGSDPVCMSCGRELDRSAFFSSPAGPPRQEEVRRESSVSVNATLILVLGGLSLILGRHSIVGLLLSPVAWVLGNKALAAADAGDGRRSGRGLIQVGRICGMISTAFLGLLLAFMTLLLQLGFSMRGATTPAVPTNVPAPALVLPDLAGRQESLAAYRGRIVMLNFFASWCGPCNAEAPHLESEVWQRWRNRGVVVIGVDTGESGSAAETAARFQSQHQLSYPILVDQTNGARQAYGVHAFPTNVIIDRRGIIRYAHAGFDPEGISRTLGELVRE
jgi:peroxiredoxin